MSAVTRIKFRELMLNVTFICKVISQIFHLRIFYSAIKCKLTLKLNCSRKFCLQLFRRQGAQLYKTCKYVK